MDTTTTKIPVPVHQPLAPKSRGGRPKGPSAKTRAHIGKLVEIFRSPPLDYDGSNSKLGEYLGLSARQVTRILSIAAEQGLIEIEIKRYGAGGPVYHSRRAIYLLKKE